MCWFGSNLNYHNIMKPTSNKLFFIIIGAIFIINCLFVYVKKRNDNSDKSTIAFTIAKTSNSHIDAANCKLNKATQVEYFIENIGDKELVIEKVEVDCHCTVAEWDKTSIPPNSKTKIIVRYDNHLPGYFKRVVVVKANLQNSPIVFTFSGTTI